jgi:hypothetical protein
MWTGLISYKISKGMSQTGQVQGGPTGQPVGQATKSAESGQSGQFGQQTGESGAVGLGGQQAGMAGEQAGGAAQQGLQAQGTGGQKGNLGAAQSGPGGMMGSAIS